MNDIWYEEIDDGFLKLIPSVVTCEYEESIFSPIYTVVGNPQQDLEDFNKCPVCVISSVGEDFSYNRNDNPYKSIVKSNDGKSAIVTPSSQPYYLYYQLTFYAKFKSDIDRISKLWRAFNGRHFRLPVTLEDGSQHLCNTDFLSSSEADNLNREVRKYIRTYSYRIWADLEMASTSKKIATQFNFNE